MLGARKGVRVDLGAASTTVPTRVYSEAVFMHQKSFSPSEPQIGLGDQPVCWQLAKALSDFQSLTNRKWA